MAQEHQIRSDILDFKPYSAGLSIAEIKKKYNLKQVLKLASNENPLGTSPLVQQTIKKYADCVFRYPRPGSPDLREQLAKTISVPQDCLVVGNGSDEIIDLLMRVKPKPRENNVIIFEPSFSIYGLQAKLCGLETRRVPLNHDLSFSFEKLLSRVDQNTSFVFITNPDNPSGYTVKKDDIFYLAERLPKNSLLIVDEAYMDFVEEKEIYSCLADWAQSSNIVVLRTFSKMYGLAGLRIGYAVMPSWLADFTLRIKLPFSVNLLAEQAALTALQDKEFYRATWETVYHQRHYLQKELKSLNCQVYPSQANFIMFRPPIEAKTIFEKLLARGIIVRTLESYGLNQHLRVSIGMESENKQLIENLREILQTVD